MASAEKPSRGRAEAALDRVRARVPEWRARAGRPFLRHREMRFPTFDAGVHDAMRRSDDYFRHATLGLAVRRVLADGVPGDLAEVGVWRGDTSALLNRLAPDRRLHLFDTFEGFPARDLPDGAEDRRFRDTSAASVRARLDSPNVVLHPGYVPDTLAEVEGERFCFVLLDLDLLQPTASSLEFFYPRLSPGAFLVVHDYNSPESDWACKTAFDAFLADKPERVVELGDVGGSALIRRAG